MSGSMVMRADMSGSMDGHEEDISVWQYGHMTKLYGYDRMTMV